MSYRHAGELSLPTASRGCGSVESLGQVHDEPLGSAHWRHAADACVLVPVTPARLAPRFSGIRVEFLFRYRLPPIAGSETSRR